MYSKNGFVIPLKVFRLDYLYRAFYEYLIKTYYCPVKHTGLKESTRKIYVNLRILRETKKCMALKK